MGKIKLVVNVDGSANKVAPRASAALKFVLVRMAPSKSASARLASVKFAFVHVAYVVGLDFWDFCAYAQLAMRYPRRVAHC